MAWCDHSIALLKDLWADGHSASRIAERINVRLGKSFTRSAIIGKKHRLKLADRPNNKIHARAQVKPPRPIERPRRTFTIKPPIEPSKVPEPDALAYDAERKAAGLTSLADLKDSDCRWPIGDPRTDDFGFCAVTAIPGQSYCSHHMRRSRPDQAPKTTRPRPPVGRPYAPSKSKELV